MKRYEDKNHHHADLPVVSIAYNNFDIEFSEYINELKIFGI